jgi:hypothetical protein
MRRAARPCTRNQALLTASTIHLKRRRPPFSLTRLGAVAAAAVLVIPPGAQADERWPPKPDFFNSPACIGCETPWRMCRGANTQWLLSNSAYIAVSAQHRTKLHGFVAGARPRGICVPASRAMLSIKAIQAEKPTRRSYARAQLSSRAMSKSAARTNRDLLLWLSVAGPRWIAARQAARRLVRPPFAKAIAIVRLAAIIREAPRIAV